MPCYLRAFIPGANGAIARCATLQPGISVVIQTHFKPLYCERKWGIRCPVCFWITL